MDIKDRAEDINHFTGWDLLFASTRRHRIKKKRQADMCV
jgi:hypothetical protein